MNRKKLTIKIARIAFVFYWLCLVTLWPLAPLVVGPVRAASSGPNSPGTMADDATIGSKTWFDLNYSKVAGEGSCSYTESDGMSSENAAYLVKGGVISGDNKSTGAGLLQGACNGSSYRTYGSSSDLWGVSLASNDINNSDFGFVFSVKYGSVISHYLKATNFGFSVPDGSSINGVVVEVKQSASGDFNLAFIDHIRITVYYTESGGGGGAPEFTVTGMLLAVMGGIAGYFVLQRRWNHES